jgi:hypothetical protein
MDNVQKVYHFNNTTSSQTFRIFSNTTSTLFFFFGKTPTLLALLVRTNMLLQETVKTFVCNSSIFFLKLAAARRVFNAESARGNYLHTKQFTLPCDSE